MSRQVAERKAQEAEQAKPLPLMTWLRKNLSLYSKHLPDAIRIPAMGRRALMKWSVCCRMQRSTILPSPSKPVKRKAVRCCVARVP